MNASEIGSADWWLVVLSMPTSEALEHLHGFKASILEKHQHTSKANAVSPHLTRINLELKRLNRLINEGTWQQAARNVLDPETFAAVLTEKRILEDGDALHLRIKREPA